ncbi:hypothetical protein [Methanofollis ethanolicus]|uniref:hypothetical protein n=1 Tax=Methanofollis ethanolicus TaxID=488124 RepID=UPI00082FB18F|nr:hypothetical protein [Methanofollis ethanolicus]
MERCDRHPENTITGRCRICGQGFCPECVGCRIQICPGCLYKGLVVALVAMVLISYTVWFGIL